jgi:hypothetical protein
MPMPIESDSQARPKHSWLGVASFVIFLVYCTLFFLVFLVSVLLTMSGEPLAKPPALPSPTVILLGIMLFASVFLSLMGVALGIAGAVQRNRRKVFAVLGIVFNGGFFLLFAGVMLLAALGMWSGLD